MTNVLLVHEHSHYRHWTHSMPDAIFLSKRSLDVELTKFACVSLQALVTSPHKDGKKKSHSDLEQ